MHLSLTTLALLLAIVPASAKNQYSHFPKVPKWYVYNGLLDKFFDESSPCVQDCIKSKANFGDIPSLPCPKWDVGCYCVMPSFNQHWLKCVSENCPQNSVETHEKAVAQCDKAGVVGDKLFLVDETRKLLEKAKDTKQEKMVPPSTKMIIEANGKKDTSKSLNPQDDEKENKKKDEERETGEKKGEEKKTDEKKGEEKKTDEEKKTVESMPEGKSAPTEKTNEEIKVEAKSGPSEDKKDESSKEVKKTHNEESKSESSMAPQSSEMISSKQSLAEISKSAKTESSSVVSAAAKNATSTKAPEMISSSNSGVALQVAIAPIVAVMFMAML